MRKTTCKKKGTKILITILTIVLLILVAIPFAYPIKVSGYFVPYEYTIHGTYIEINRYIGTDPEVEIPACLWFRPVKEISCKYNDGAFYNMDYVTYIKLPNTVTTLSGAPFWGCWNLEEIEISKNIKEIPTGSFANCTKLQEIVLHEKVEELYGNAFAGCKLLQRVISYNPNMKIGEDVFDNGFQCCNFDILTLVSEKDSAIEKYAKEHGIKWEELVE